MIRPFRHRLPAALAALFLAQAGLLMLPLGARAQNNPGDSVLSGIQIHKLNLVFPLTWSGAPGDTAAWTSVRNTMRANKESEVYIPARLEINCDATRANPGCVLLDSVGVRYKGNSTFSQSREKNPFRISFDEYGIEQKWNGMEGFILNNANMDPSHMAEKIHMDFAVERAGMPGPRFAYANVHVNGFPYSFYLLGELADNRLLESSFGEKDGDLFKAIDGTSNNSDFTTNSFTNRRYEFKGDSATRAWARLGSVITAVNGSNVETALPQLVNMNGIYRAFAADVLFGSTDSYMGVGQNYLVYFPEAPGSKMEWVLWDASLSFGKAPFGDANNSTTTPGGNCARSATGNILCGPTNKPLINKIVTTQALREDYIRSFWFLYKAYFEGDWLTKRIDSVAAVIRPHLDADRYRIGLTNMTTFDNNVTTLKTFVTSRQASVNSQFATHGISAANAIRNRDVVLNEVAPTQGWVEVYNARDYAIDLSAHSLTNDPAQPNKWSFPAASFVPPRGYLVVRLQGGALGAAGPANFALPATGGHLRLTRANGTVVDSMSFGAQAGDSTIARATDGGTAIVAGFPTPGAANVAAANAPASLAPLAVVINEFMADNDTLASPAGVKADWIELYNKTSASVSLAGLHLSDNMINPSKWTFPSGTNIPANGYLVVWAYDTTVSGALFADWSLSKDGEHIRLSNADSSVVDSVTFGAQTKSRTAARVPNGTGAFSSTCVPTLGAANTCVVTGIARGAGAFGRDGLTLARGGAGRIAARFTLAEAGAARLSVLDARGREVALLFEGRLNAGAHERMFEASHLPAGLYVFRLRAGGAEHLRAGVLMLSR